MTSKKQIEDFLSVKTVAVVGVSANKKKFGSIIFNDLKSKGYITYPVNPNTKEIDGEKCYPDLISLAGKAEAAVIVVPPEVTNVVVKDAFKAGIIKIWMQQGSESKEAIKFCEENNISVITNQCILMFAQPSGFIHKAHKWILNLTGQLPK